MTNENMKERNVAHCKSIADQLDAIARGVAYINPEDHGDIVEYSDEEEPPEDWEQASMWDFFEDSVYAERFLVSGGTHEYEGVQLMVACGGPNIWVDTITNSVNLYWWGDEASYPLTVDAANAVDDFGCELWFA